MTFAKRIHLRSRVVGLDIGSTALRAVEVVSHKRTQTNTLHVYEVLLPKGAVVAGEVVETEIVVAALNSLWLAGGFKSKNVILGLANQNILVRELVIEKMSQSRLQESLPFLAQSQTQIPIAISVFDFYPISELSGDIPMIKGLLVAAEKERILQNFRAVVKAGLKPIRIDLTPFALSRLLVSKPGVSKPVALIDIGAATSSLTISIGEIPQFVRMLPSGGDKFTQALANGLSISFAEAQILKHNIEPDPEVTTPQHQRAMEILEVESIALINSLRNTINYFSNTHLSAPIAEIMLTGGGSQLIGFARALATETQIPVVPVELFSTIIRRTQDGTAELAEVRIPITVALALALPLKKVQR